MIRDRWHRDPAHGQTLPQGDGLARLLHAYMEHVGRDAAAQVAQGRQVDLSRWIRQLAETSGMFFSQYVLVGQRRKAKELIQAVQAAGRQGRVKSISTASSVTGIDFGWDLYRPEVSEWIRRATYDFAKSTMDTAASDANAAIAKFREQLREGMERGDATEELNRRVVGIFRDPYKAARVAQTESARAMMAGQIDVAHGSGIVSKLKWLASSDACPEVCLPLNGKEVKLGEPFMSHKKPGPYQMVYYPPAHPHCLLGETTIRVSNAVGAVKANYRGPGVRVVLVSGESFTCTPNHMLLTPNGFALASSLVNGDDLVYCPHAERLIGDGPNDYRQPTRIDEVVRATTEAGGMSSRSVPVSPEYLHGDAAFCQGNIDVVRANGLLRDERDLMGAETGSDPQFERTMARFGLVRQSPFDLLFKRHFLTASRDVGRSRDLGAIRRAHRRVSLAENLSHRLSLAANLPAGLLESSNDSSASYAEDFRQAQHRFPGVVASVKVRQVDVVSLHDVPVYDVETSSTCYIIGSGVVSSNCMCAMTEVIDPSNATPQNMAILGRMAFGRPPSTNATPSGINVRHNY